MISSNILYFCTFIVSYKNESMAKKNEIALFDDIIDGKDAMLQFIDIFRKAIKGDKFAVKLANKVLDEWQEECENLPDKDEKDENFAFLPPLADDDLEDDEFLPPYEKPTLKRPNVSEYHLRIKLNDTYIKIWRELKVPSNVELDFLGHLLIEIMGWEDVHLFHFLHNNMFYSDQESVYMSFSGNTKLYSDFALSDLLKSERDKMTFEYDFGDSWWHEISVVGIRPYKKGEKHRIIFVDGHGACPPEDCGGMPGYKRLLEMAKKKRKSTEDKEELEWYNIGKNYDPNDPDIEFCREIAEDWNWSLKRK